MGTNANKPQFSITEEYGEWSDGVKKYSKRWIPSSSRSPRAVLIALHGFAEHIGRYDHVWPVFAEQGIEVLGYDQRGFGRSGPTHGDTTLKQSAADLASLIEKEKSRSVDNGLPEVPLFIYAHSMGATVLLYLITQSDLSINPTIPNSVRGVVCAAPWILRAKPPSPFILSLAPWLLWLVPNLPFYKSINPQGLTSDEAAAETYHSDPLHDGNVYLKTVLEPLVFGYRLLEKGYRNWPVHLSILITHGDKDQSTSVEASRSFIEKIQADDKELKTWPDMLHEGHNERPDIRDTFLDYSIRWIKDRC